MYWLGLIFGTIVVWYWFQYQIKWKSQVWDTVVREGVCLCERETLPHEWVFVPSLFSWRLLCAVSLCDQLTSQAVSWLIARRSLAPWPLGRMAECHTARFLRVKCRVMSHMVAGVDVKMYTVRWAWCSGQRVSARLLEMKGPCFKFLAFAG